jgi:hypothetical protein
MVGFFMKEHFSGTLKMLIYILRVPQKCSFKIHLFIELEQVRLCQEVGQAMGLHGELGRRGVRNV